MKGKFGQQSFKNKILVFWITWIVLIGFTYLLTVFLPSSSSIANGESIGFFAFIPAIFLVIYIFSTKRILEALVLASTMCFIFADRGNFLTSFNQGLTSVMMEENTGWLIIVCGLMGSIIKLIEKTGGSFAFGNFVAPREKPHTGAAAREQPRDSPVIER